MKTLLQTGLLLLAISSTLTSITQVPIYNSNPTATAVVFLDFDGHTINGTSWNYNGPIVCAATTLNNTQITTIFNRVAEDFRPFNLNITTDSAKFLVAPLNGRMRIVLTVSSGWFGSGAGGVSFVSSFTWGDDTPCFVFTALLNNNVKNIAEAASHEAGHTMGLYHQSTYNDSCVKISDYNFGAGTGEIGWAPIMGNGYNKNLTLWNIGPYSFSCTDYQNDLAVLTTLNGYSYRTDDHAATFAAATDAPFVSTQFTVNGIVERNTDEDMIKFTQPSFGRFQLNAIPYNVGTGNAGSNLDLQVTLYNNLLTQLNLYNPGILLNSFIDTILNPGIYYLKVEGSGNIYASNYASLGSYSLQGTFTENIVLPLRRLELNAISTDDRHNLSWIIDADELVVQQTLEIATDGRSFIPLSHPALNDRSFIYRPTITSTAQYQLSVTFDNGHQYYSNIVTLRKIGSDSKAKLVSNLVNSNTLAVTSQGIYTYYIYDFKGRTVDQGQLKIGLNSINAIGITNAGMYIIRFVNAAEVWTEKFIRQ